jgi:hypothetical protein
MSDRHVTTPATQSVSAQATGHDGDDHDPVIRLIEEWLADDSGYDEEAWPELKAALDRDRLSSRQLFDG